MTHILHKIHKTYYTAASSSWIQCERRNNAAQRHRSPVQLGPAVLAAGGRMGALQLTEQQAVQQRFNMQRCIQASDSIK